MSWMHLSDLFILGENITSVSMPVDRKLRIGNKISRSKIPNFKLGAKCVF